MASKGRYTYTCVRNSVGLYTISPSSSTPFTDNNYIVSLSFHIEVGTNVIGRIVLNSVTATSFQVGTYVNNIVADCMFHFSVLI